MVLHVREQQVAMEEYSKDKKKEVNDYEEMRNKRIQENMKRMVRSLDIPLDCSFSM